MVSYNCESKTKLTGKVAIVTGATSGLGLEIAKDLASRGAKVIIASRNPAKLENAKNIIRKSAGHDNVVARQMDFESLASVRSFARETLASEPRLDVLVNNIGALGLPDKHSADGLQLTMQVNYFGTFLLTFLLFPLLKASAPSRVVNIASFMALISTMDVDHINDLGKYPHAPFAHYTDAKRALVLFTIEMDKRIKGSGVTVYSIDPGLINTGILSNFPEGFLKDLVDATIKAFGKSPRYAARTPVYFAVSPAVTASSGRNFLYCVDELTAWFGRDPAETRRLWNISKRLIRIGPEEDWELT